MGAEHPVAELLAFLVIHKLVSEAFLELRISSNALNRIELSKAEPYMSKRRKLVRALDVDPAERLGD